MQSVANFDAVLKEVYLPGVREELNQKTNLLDVFTESDLTQYEWQGREVVFALHSSRNYSGVKYTAELGGLPTAGNQGTADLKVPITHLSGHITLSAAVIKASRSDKGSFTRAMDLEQKGLVNDIARQRNRALAGYGSEILALITTGATSQTQTIKNPGGVAGTTNPGRFLQPGMIVNVTDPTGVTIRGGGTVTSVTSGNQLTITGSGLATTTGDIITLATSTLTANEGSFGLGAMGLLGLADSTTYVTTIFGLDRSQTANAYFTSNVLTAVGTINADVVQRGIDNTEERSGQVIDKFVCHQSIRREIAKLTEADRRYTGSDKPQNFDAGTLAGAGKKDLTFNGWTIRQDKDMAYGTLVGVNTDHLFWLPETKGEWADDDGSILLRLSAQDAYEARYRVKENFACDQGNALLRFDGITANVTSTIYAD